MAEDWAHYWNEIHRRHGIDRRGDPGALQAVLRPEAPRLYNRAVDYFQRMHLSRAFQRLAPWPGRMVLEVGCGGGRWCRELASRGALVTGVDHSPTAIGLNRATCEGPPIRFETMRATSLVLLDAVFDVALTITVLQHVPYDDQPVASRELARVLKPGGHLLTVELVDNRIAPGTCTARGDAFPRTSADWRRLHEASGLVLVHSHKHALVPLTTTYIGGAREWVESRLRRNAVPGPRVATPMGSVSPASPGGQAPDSQSPHQPRPRWMHALNDAFWRLAVDASVVATFPVEWLANRFLERDNSHLLMIFRKPL